MKLKCHNFLCILKNIQRLGQISMLKWICYLKSAHSPLEGPEHIPFTIILCDKFVKEASALLKNFVAVFSKSQIKELVATKLGSSNAIGVIGS